MKKRSVTDAIHHRRSVRIQSNRPIEASLVKSCIENAILAPNSSNMQLWEFYHITSASAKKEIREACFNQSAAKTAQQLVIPVVRMDLWKSRLEALKQNLINQFKSSEERNPEEEAKAFAYLEKDLPKVYQKKSWWANRKEQKKVVKQGKSKAVYREIGAENLRIIGHKSVALAAQNFMVSMAEIGYDTCPMEGFDSLRIKEHLALPPEAEISMVIGCGIRADNGVYGPQFRLPLEKVYFKI